jgi:hypothetical protein
MVIIKHVILYIMSIISCNVDGELGLQNCMDILKSERGPCTGTYQMSCDDGNQFVGIKVEDVTDMKEEEDPWPATSTGIKTEPTVSCLPLFIQFYVHWTSNVHTM